MMAFWALFGGVVFFFHMLLGSRFWAAKTILFMVFRARNLKCWVLGPTGSERAEMTLHLA